MYKENIISNRAPIALQKFQFVATIADFDWCIKMHILPEHVCAIKLNISWSVCFCVYFLLG